MDSGREERILRGNGSEEQILEGKEALLMSYCVAIAAKEKWESKSAPSVSYSW